MGIPHYNIAYGLQHWTRLFKAATWEELKALTTDYKDLDNIVDIVRDALADANIRMQCEARERYERDGTAPLNPFSKVVCIFI